MLEPAIDNELTGPIEARVIGLERIDAWTPDHGNITARAVTGCPWHGSSHEDRVLVLAAVLADGIYPTRWFCTACHRGGIARLESGKVRLEWNGKVRRRLGTRA